MNLRVVGQLFWKRGLPMIGVVVLLAQIFWWTPYQVAGGPLQLSDADAYHVAARHAVAGEQVYATDLRTTSIIPPTGFLYPPSALALLTPAARLTSRAWRTTFCLIAIAAMWSLAAALVRLGTGRVAVADVLAVGALLAAFPPTGVVMKNGNLEIVVVALTAWAFAAPRVSAALLVVAASIKVYPGFVLAAWLPRTTKRYWLQAGATLAAVALLTLVAGEAHYVREWLRLGLPSLSAPTTAYGNWSISTVVLCDSYQYALADVRRSLRLSLSIAPIIAAAVAYIVTRRKARDVAGVGVLIAGMWASAICWWCHLALAFTIPAAMWIARRRETERDPQVPSVR